MLFVLVDAFDPELGYLHNAVVPWIDDLDGTQTSPVEWEAQLTLLLSSPTQTSCALGVFPTR